MANMTQFGPSRMVSSFTLKTKIGQQHAKRCLHASLKIEQQHSKCYIARD